MHEPLGEAGLKVDEARLAVKLLATVPVGTEKGVLVVGPIEMANAKAADVMLKSIEEFDERFIQPILWTHDLGGVSPTIKSRCLDRWAPSLDEIPDDDELVAAGYDLIQASQEREYWRLSEIVSRYIKTHKGGEYDLLRAAADALYTQLDGDENRQLWQQIRKAASNRNPTAIEITAAFLPPLEDLE
jgi:hypothetical protein